MTPPTEQGQGQPEQHEQQRPDLSYHLAWVLFQVYATVINIPTCLYWAGGPARVQYIVQESSGLDLALICIFALLWGVGSVFFGVACKIAGVGLGTNLSMGIIMILGTFLPLCLDGAIGTAAGGVVVAGLVVCSGGLWSSVQSLRLRDAEERQHRIRRRTMQNVTVSINADPAVIADAAASTAASEITSTSPPPAESATTTAESPTTDNDPELEKPPQESEEEEGYSTFQKVMVCVIAGVFATQLQFAFVFGSDMVDMAEDSSQGPGSTPPSGTSAVIWLFAISLGAPASIVYGLYSNPSTIPLSRIYQCPWYRHLFIILTTSIPWVAHIHLYGYATTYLPSDLAASVAWPVLMMMTVIAGMIWSIALGEWNLAPEQAKFKLYQGLGLVLAGVAIIMASVAI